MADYGGYYPPRGTATRIMDDESMPSPQAAMARARSEEVMQALKSGEPGAADKLMQDESAKGSDGLLKRLKRKLGGGLKGEKVKAGTDSAPANDELTAGTSLADTYNGPDTNVMSRDGGKGDGVIR